MVRMAHRSRSAILTMRSKIQNPNENRVHVRWAIRCISYCACETRPLATPNERRWFLDNATDSLVCTIAFKSSRVNRRTKFSKSMALTATSLADIYKRLVSETQSAQTFAFYVHEVAVIVSTWPTWTKVWYWYLVFFSHVFIWSNRFVVLNWKDAAFCHCLSRWKDRILRILSENRSRSSTS